MSKSQIKINLSAYSALMIWVLGFLMFVYNYIVANYTYNFSQNLFWVSIIICCSSSLLGIIKSTQRPWLVLIFIFLFSLPFSSINFLAYPSKFIIPDEIYHYQYTKMIYETGIMQQPTILFNMLNYYPGFEMLSVSMKLIFGNFVSMQTFAKIFPLLVHSLLIFFLFKLYSNISNSMYIGSLATIIYITNPYFTRFDSRYSYETLGVVYLGLLLLLLYKNRLGNKIAVVIVLCALTVTHHLSSYMLNIIMIILLVEIMLYGKTKMTVVPILSIVLVFGWVIYQAVGVISYYDHNIGKTMMETLKLFTRESQPKTLLEFNLPFYEIIIDKFLYFPLLSILFIIGFLKYKKNISNTFIFTMLGLGTMFFLTTPLLLTSDSGRYAMRLWSFDYIGLSFFVAIAINSLIQVNKKLDQNKKVILAATIMSIMVIIIGGMSIGQNPYIRSPWNPNKPAYSTGVTAYSNSFINTGSWIKATSNTEQKIIGDLTIKYMIGGYGDMHVNTGELATQVILSDELDEKILKNYNLIAINKLMEELPVNKGDIKDSMLSIKLGYNKVAAHKINKFDKYAYLLRHYDNDKTILYKINKL